MVFTPWGDMMQQFDDIPEKALAWHQSGAGAALATVVETWGSAPRRVGSQLAISGQADMAGSVSGGCVEGAVVAEALDAIKDGQPRLLEYGVSDGDAFAVGLACGGTICIWLDPIGAGMPEADLQAIVDARAARRAVGYQVDQSDQSRRLIDIDDAPERFRADRSGFDAEKSQFVTIHNPPLRVAIVGAVHIAQALVPMAKIAGYDPIIIDPREAFASDARFPGERLMHDWPDEALAALGLDARTGLVLLTHDPKLDDPAIHAGLRSDVFYIGALGSTRTHAKRVDRLLEAGFTDADIARIHGPVGLDIGASGPSEIAVSILGQMTAVLRGKA